MHHCHHFTGASLPTPFQITISATGSNPAAQHGWIYDWQTLIAGVLALLAAVATALVIYRQVRVAEEQENRRRNRRLSAARATLPLTLATIMDYTQASAHALLSSYPTSPGLLGASTPLPAHSPFPAEAIGALERMIEATDDEAVSERLIGMITEAQVIDSRRRRAHATRSDVDVYLLQLAKIAGAAAVLFPYARREDETISDEYPWDEILTQLKILGVDPEIHPEAWGIAQRAKDRATKAGTPK
jgi:hypothetical protein